jgi:O-antigen/teichoic acid export membrane protein
MEEPFRDAQGVSVRDALMMSAAARIGTIAIGTLGVMLLSRLLTPAEIGIFSISAAVIAIAQALREFGISAYLSQEQELTPQRVATALGLAIIVGWTLGLSLLAISWPAAQLYSEPGIGSTIRTLALGFFIIPLGSSSIGVLYREMRFREIAYINLASTFVHTLSSVGLALAGASYMSLAYANLLGLITNIVGLAILRAPYLFIRPTLSEWRRVTAFSIYSCVSLLITYGGSMAPELIVGRFLGIPPVAYLSRANSLPDMFRNTMLSVTQTIALSAFSTARREGTDLKAHYLRAMALYTGVAWPFFAVLAISAAPFIRLLYGSQWDDSAPLLQVLCAAGAFAALSMLAGQAFYAIGQPRRLMWREAVTQGTFVLLVVVAAQLSLLLVAWTFVIGSAVAFFSAQYHLSAALELRLRDVCRAVGSSAGLSLICAIPPTAITHWMSWRDHGSLASMALISISCIMAWVAGIVFIRHPLRAELLTTIRGLRRTSVVAKHVAQ